MLQKKETLHIRDRLISTFRPLVMGVLNITPDSFFDGGRYYKNKKTIKEQYLKMVSSGADIIDIGAYSSRPGATHISEKEEFSRLAFALEILSEDSQDTVISIDTFRSNIVHQAASRFQIDFVNDISGGNMDSNIMDTTAFHQLGYIAMHMQGTPQTMQINPQYNNLIDDIILELSKKIDLLKKKGVQDIIIDPGFGFGKTIEQNFSLLKNLNRFNIFELPLLVGLSRKSMICKTLGVSPEKALHGSGALQMLALKNGADLLRVHDVAEAKEIINLWNNLQKV